MKPLEPSKMKCRPVLSALCLGFLLLSTAGAYGEGSGRGGGDNPSMESEAAWFIGDQMIRYCVETSRDFGVDSAAAEREVEGAFAHWSRYIEKREVNTGRKPFEAILLKRERLDSCDGRENLKFYLGTTSPEVETAKKQYDKPTAFVKRTASQPPKGFVWLAPSKSIDQGEFVPEQAFPHWGQPHQLEGFLLHEVGHIAGNGHVVGTIMDDTELRVQARGWWQDGKHVVNVDRLTHIDQYVALYSCEHCAYSGTVSLDPAQAKKAFELFMGRKPAGKIRAQFTQRPSRREDVPPRFILSDDKGSKEISIKVDMNDPGAWGLIEIWQTVFKVASNGPIMEVDECGRENQVGTQSGSVGRHVEAGAGYGTIVAADGKEYPWRMDFNVRTSNSNSPVQLRYFSNGKWLDLYQMELDE